jgi:hypothetical protein
LCSCSRVCLSPGYSWRRAAPLRVSSAMVRATGARERRLREPHRPQQAEKAGPCTPPVLALSAPLVLPPGGARGQERLPTAPSCRRFAAACVWTSTIRLMAAIPRCAPPTRAPTRREPSSCATPASACSGAARPEPSCAMAGVSRSRTPPTAAVPRLAMLRRARARPRARLSCVKGRLVSSAPAPLATRSVTTSAWRFRIPATAAERPRAMRAAVRPPVTPRSSVKVRLVSRARVALAPRSAAPTA